MSFITHQLPRHLTMWVLGRSLEGSMDLGPLIRLGLLGVGAMVIGVLFAITCVGFLLAAFYIYLTAHYGLSESTSLFILAGICLALAVGVFCAVRHYLNEFGKSGRLKVKNILGRDLTDAQGLMESSKTILGSFIEGLTGK